MATRLPIDGNALTFIATGKYRPVKEYAELADGSRRAIPDSQAKNDAGLPIWTVDAMLDDDEADRAEPIGVKVATATEPQPPKYQPISFTGLVCTPYVDRRTNRVGLSFSATGIATAGGRKSAAGE